MQKGRNTLSVRAISKKKLRQLVMQNLRDWDTPRSLSIYLIMKSGTDADFLNLEAYRPEYFNSPVSYAEFSLPMDLVRKSQVLDLGINTRDAAIVRFHQAEEQCRQTNLRLDLGNDPNGRLGEFVHRVRKIIADTLPEIDREILDNFIEDGGWGKGVTSTVKSRSEGQPNWKTFCSKLVSHQHATSRLLPIARKLSESITGMSDTISVRDYNEVAFVPKDAKTDRAIAVEPSLNAYLQRGAGVLIRRSLRRLGVDLIHGQLRNGALAKAGSQTGELATVDLSSASDTMSYKLIWYLLPPEWVSLLLLLRTPHYRLNGEIKSYHKWSSMGNGYTFELESLIFAAAAKAVSGNGQWAVYGDDIIVPSTAVQDLASLLDHFGFSFNQDKSFTSGPFRESCGKDYFLGVAVRGFFLKEINPITVFVWHNWLAAERLLIPCHRTLRSLRKLAPQCCSPFPDDGAFWVPPIPDHTLGLSRGYRAGRLGWFFNKVTFVPISRRLSKRTEIGAIATYCRQVQADLSIDRLPPMEVLDTVGRWKQKRVFVCDWETSRKSKDTWPRG